MKFLRAWWLQILGVVVVLGFLAWLGLEGIPLPGRHVSGAASGTPTLTAQQEIEATIKDFVVAYDLSGQSEDPSAAQAFCKPQSPAEGEAAVNSDWSKRNGETFVVDQRSWDETSWVTAATGDKTTADATLAETGHWAAVPGLAQKDPEQTFHIQWKSSQSFIGGRWELTDFQEITS